MLRTACAVAAGATLASAVAANAAVPTTRVFTDPFTNATSQHRAIVEPDTFAFGSTLVAATQSGRFFDGGASGIGVATTTDNGATWSSSTLSGITTHQPGGTGAFDRVSDPSVAFDA